MGSVAASRRRALSARGSAPSIPTHRTFIRWRFGNAPVPTRRPAKGEIPATLARIASTILGARASSVSPRNFRVRCTWETSTSLSAASVRRSSSTRALRLSSSGRSTEMKARNATASRPLGLPERAGLRVDPAPRVPLPDAEGHQLLRLVLRPAETLRHRRGGHLPIALEEGADLGEPAVPPLGRPVQPREREGGEQGDPCAESRGGGEGRRRASRGEGERPDHPEDRDGEEPAEGEEEVHELRRHEDRITP